MKKIIISLMIILGILFPPLYFAIPSQNAKAFTDTKVIVTPDTINSVADFTISGRFGAELDAGQKIYIKFPDAYVLPSTISTDAIKIVASTINIGISAVTVAGNTIEITIANGIGEYYPFSIDITTAANIQNPSVPSTYALEIWTDTDGSETDPYPTSFFITIPGGTGTQVSGLTVQVNPALSGKPADYLIIFNVSQTGSLVAANGDYVDVIFPAGTIMPKTIDPSKVLMKTFPCTQVNITGTTVKVYVPDALGLIAPGEQCNIEFLTDFGIKNPLKPGKYAIGVLTSKDTGFASSNLYDIVGTPITNLQITADPTSQSAVAQYKIDFTTSDTGNLTAGTDQIFVEFPKGYTLPDNLVPGAITVNNVPCVSVSKGDDNTLVITTPVSVGANSSVTVLISKSFGLKNPDSTGDYTITVYTTQDTAGMSDVVTITTSSISNVNVTLSNTSSATVCAYNISFETGTSGALTPGTDKINIIFPVGTTIPDSIPLSAVTVNGVPVTNIAISGTTVTLTVPVSIPAKSVVHVMISDKAGIKNPVQGGTYNIYVSTSKETTAVASNTFKIAIVPHTQVQVVPSEPNGNNGYYTVQPMVSFTATSPVDPNPMVYYYFDNNAPVLFTGQAIKVPEGVHTLYYYAVDHQNHKEKVQAMVFKVDTVPPQIVVLSPKNGAVLNSRTVVVKGKVDKGCVVTVSGETAEVDQNGNFTATLQLTSNNATLIIVAKDPAGNVSQTKLSVSVDTTPPALTVTNPVPFQEVHRLPLVVKGKTEKGATVTVNGNPAEVDSNGNFTYVMNNLNETGFTMITVIAKDAAGNETKKVINVKYIKTTIIKLQINNKVALVNSSTVQLDAAPVIKNNRTLVPLRFVSEAFGATLSWDPIFRIIDITLGDSKIRLQIGTKFAAVNGKKVPLDVAPQLIKNRTMVPIRFVSEALNAEVLWDQNTKTITIIYPKPTQSQGG